MRTTRQERELEGKLWEAIRGLCGRREDRLCNHSLGADHCLDESCPILAQIEQMLKEAR